MDLGISGLASNFDWRSFIEQISDIERTPQKRLRNEQAKLEDRNIAYGSFVTQLNVLKNKVSALSDASIFGSRTAVLSDATVASASVSSGAVLGSHSFNITQLATTSAQLGSTNAGHRLSDSSDVSGLELADAKFATAITAGTFTVNGKQITVAATDSLGEVFGKINAATGNVTATYNESTDKIQLDVSGVGNTVVLGSATDTSNFLAVARLYNNGTNSVTSSFSLGAIQQSAKLNVANFDTAISDGGSGAGSFKINGVSIAFNASTDSVTSVVNRINASSAGVTASYDSVNDRFVLNNNTTGDMGIALEDVTGNFLAASGLSGGTLSRGKNLLYTIDNGGELTSLTNTITATSSGITGLSLTALTEGSTTVEVKADTDSVKKAITDFIAEYNRTQSLIDRETASSTDAKGAVTRGTLASEREATELASKLRSMVNSEVTGLSGVFDQLASLGISSNGVDDMIELEDSDLLDEALANNLSSIQELFSDETDGLAVRLEAYIERTAGDEGSLLALQDSIAEQSDDIDDQVAALERQVLANEQRLITSFVAMERAQANINQQLQFLQQRFGSS